MRFINSREFLAQLRELRASGKTPEQISKITGNTPEYIASLLASMGRTEKKRPVLMRKRHSSSGKRQPPEKKISDGQAAIIGLLKQHAIGMAHDDAMRESLCYYLQHHANHSGIPLERIYRLFSAYYGAKTNCEKLSVRELVEISGIRVHSAERLLRWADLDTMHSPKKNPNREASRAYYTDMPLTDVAYFLGMPRRSLETLLNREFGSIGERTGSPALFYANGRMRNVTYRDASQIYEAMDWGWTPNDIACCLDRDISVIEYAAKNRETIGRKITGVLDALFPGTVHSNPYLEK